MSPSASSTMEIVRSLGALCGGVDGGEDQISLGRLWKEEVCFKACGNENGFAPIGCFLNQDDVAFKVRFVRLKQEEWRSSCLSSEKEKLKSSIGGSTVGDVDALHPCISLLILRKVQNWEYLLEIRVSF